MTDANETLAEGKSFASFIDSTNLIDVMELLNPSLIKDKTYLWSDRRLDYIFVSPGIKDAAVKAGHHNFHQHIISDHKGVYVHFKASELFATGKMDETHLS